jgi:OOP family OmpA-OmpF porin
LLGTTGPSASSLFIAEYLGPNAAIYVVALGDGGASSASAPGQGAYSKAPVPVKTGTVLFSANSARLTPAAKRALRRYASLVAAQGFTSVKVSGHMAKYERGNYAYRRRFSLKRAKAVKAYLAAEFKRKHRRVSITTIGYGRSKPVASNKTKSGRAKNRRAELLLR